MSIPADHSSVNCPNCGAAMRLKDDADYLVCDYCETPHFPDPNSDGVRVLGVEAEIYCPVCAISLTHASVARERMFYCRRCRGMLISMNVFTEIVQELRSRREISVDAAHPPDWKDLDRQIHCPKCGATWFMTMGTRTPTAAPATSSSTLASGAW